MESAPFSSESRYFLEASYCGFQGEVCCPIQYRLQQPPKPQFQNQPNQPIRNGEDNNVGTNSNAMERARKVCGIQVTPRIINGENTKLTEFPWMALLQYRSSKFSKSSYVKVKYNKDNEEIYN